MKYKILSHFHKFCLPPSVINKDLKAVASFFVVVCLSAAAAAPTIVSITIYKQFSSSYKLLDESVDLTYLQNIWHFKLEVPEATSPIM